MGIDMTCKRPLAQDPAVYEQQIGSQQQARPLQRLPQDQQVQQQASSAAQQRPGRLGPEPESGCQGQATSHPFALPAAAAAVTAAAAHSAVQHTTPHPSKQDLHQHQHHHHYQQQQQEEALVVQQMDNKIPDKMNQMPKYPSSTGSAAVADRHQQQQQGLLNIAAAAR